MSGIDALPDAVMAIVDPAEQIDDDAPWPRLAAGEIASYERERRFAHRDGSLRWGSVTISALRDDTGAFIGALAQIQDITAQKAAEATVRENEARLMALVEQLPVALYRQEPGAAGLLPLRQPVVRADHRAAARGAPHELRRAAGMDSPRRPRRGACRRRARRAHR